MSKKLILFISLLLSTVLSAQQMTITDFELNLHDQTANNEDTKVIDDNGNPCALLKIETLQKGFSIDGGSVGIAKIEQEEHKGEIWVFVPANLRRITIAHDQLGVLRDYVFPEKLQPARTYTMRLVSGTVQTVVNQKRTSQVFVLTFTPKNAMVEVDGTMVETDDGTYSDVLSFGRHEYRISAKNYHTEVGIVTIGEEKQSKIINLSPAFGWIEIKGPNGASVYIDGEKVGIAPMKSEPVASGSHDVRVIREKYLPHREQVLVNDNTTTTVNPVLTANFVSITLKTEGDADIFINGEKVGLGTVVTDLTPGEYSFETRKTSHRSQTVVRQITMASAGTIELPAPVAIVGSIMVNVKPVGARVTVDGKPSGESPVILDNVLIGTHDVVISKAGCAERRER
ncbi:MAG: PEGA domain-containing protein, partial [bacterium]|nr:PEGA domain-containing protein [Candidatus Minthenecus merdequi]